MSRLRASAAADIGDSIPARVENPPEQVERARIRAADWAVRFEVPTDELADVLDALGILPVERPADGGTT